MAGSKTMLVSVIEKLAEKVGDQFSITVQIVWAIYQYLHQNILR